MDSPVALAPMAGISDLPYRVICRKFGCGLTVSEMVSAKGLLYKNEKTYAMLQIDEAERPTAIQLFGSVPEELAEAARIVEARILYFSCNCNFICYRCINTSNFENRCCRKLNVCQLCYRSISL